jgi:folylpolyglutamate synthase
MAHSTNPTDRWDCIYINDKPVAEAQFKKIENHFKSLNQRENIQASEFELLTATAFQLFNEHNVTFGVVEVGMGGTLDSTNILNNQVVSVIGKIAHDHQNFLGTTLLEIAQHKAGILRPNVPYIVNPANEFAVKGVIHDYAKMVGAGPEIDPLAELQNELRSPEDHRDWEGFISKRPSFQRHNALLAYFAVKQALDGRASLMKSLKPLKEPNLPGRCEKHAVPFIFNSDAPNLLVDGAHNADAAAALDEYVSKMYRRQWIAGTAAPPNGWPITWVMAMSEGKDPATVLEKLLKPGDSLVLTTFGPVDGMPWVKPMPPTRILETAEQLIPDIPGIVVPTPGVHRALIAARELAASSGSLMVLTGSLYLVGDFLREKAQWKPSAEALAKMNAQEKRRVFRFLSSQTEGKSSLSLAKETEDADFDDVDQEQREETVTDDLYRPTQGSRKTLASVDADSEKTTKAERTSSSPQRSPRKKDPLEQYFRDIEPTKGNR